MARGIEQSCCCLLAIESGVVENRAPCCLCRPVPEAAGPEKPNAAGRWSVEALRRIVFLLIVSIAPFVLRQQGWQTYATPLGGHKTVMLADGSKIDINTDTILRTNLSNSRRTVDVVQGEAYFHVRHDASVPLLSPQLVIALWIWERHSSFGPRPVRWKWPSQAAAHGWKARMVRRDSIRKS